MTTFSKAIKKTGSNLRTVNVDRDGQPFGQLWTFARRGEVNPWHAKPLDGEHRTFPTLALAKAHMAAA